MRKFELFEEVHVKPTNRNGQIIDLLSDAEGNPGYTVEDDDRDENGDVQLNDYAEEDLEKITN